MEELEDVLRVCEVHGLELLPDNVDVIHEHRYYSNEYLEAVQRQFPHAESLFVTMGAPFEGTRAAVWYCPACRQAELQWQESGTVNEERLGGKRGALTPSHDALKSLSAEALWQFLKWLAFGQGRYVGIRIETGVGSGESSERLQQLARDIARAPKQPDDAALGIAFPAVDDFGEDAALVTKIAEYVAARQVALYRDAADFEPWHAVAVQEDALRRIGGRLG